MGRPRFYKSNKMVPTKEYKANWEDIFDCFSVGFSISYFDRDQTPYLGHGIWCEY